MGLRHLAKTLAGCWAEIINYARSGGASNRFAEAVNHLTKNRKRARPMATAVVGGFARPNPLDLRRGGAFLIRVTDAYSL